MWSTDTLYPEEQASSPSRFNLTVKELLLSGAGGDLVGILVLSGPRCQEETPLSALHSLGGTQRPREDLGCIPVPDSPPELP